MTRRTERTRKLALLRDERGLTVTELLVAMAISSIVGALTLALILGINASTRATTERSAATAEARVAFDEWRDLLAVRESPTRDEAAWPAVEAITSRELAFYSSLGNRDGDGDPTAPTLIRITADAGRLLEQRYTPTEAEGSPPQYPDEPTSERLLSLAADLGVAAFDAQGRQIGLSEELPEATRAQIDRIELTLTITDKRGQQHTFGAVS